MTVAENFRCSLFPYMLDLCGYSKAMDFHDHISMLGLPENRSVHIADMTGGFSQTLRNALAIRSQANYLPTVRWNVLHCLNQVTVETRRRQERNDWNKKLRDMRDFPLRSSLSTSFKKYVLHRDNFNDPSGGNSTLAVAFTMGNAKPMTTVVSRRQREPARQPEDGRDEVTQAADPTQAMRKRMVTPVRGPDEQEEAMPTTRKKRPTQREQAVVPEIQTPLFPTTDVLKVTNRVSCGAPPKLGAQASHPTP